MVNSRYNNIKIDKCFLRRLIFSDAVNYLTVIIIPYIFLNVNRKNAKDLKLSILNNYL